jgi:hypothetical protein
MAALKLPAGTLLSFSFQDPTTVFIVIAFPRSMFAVLKMICHRWEPGGTLL